MNQWVREVNCPSVGAGGIQNFCLVGICSDQKRVGFLLWVHFCAVNTNLLMMLFLVYDFYFCQIKGPKFYKKQKSTLWWHGGIFLVGGGNEFFLVWAEFGMGRIWCVGGIWTFVNVSLLMLK